MRGFSQAYIAHIEAGPFPGRIDPWVENDHFFHPLHNEMIGTLLGDLRLPLYHLGYVAGRETSLQIAEGREPDVYVHYRNRQETGTRWSYELAAAEVLAEPGNRSENVSELDALHIRDAKTGDLVTVIELVSPGNKIRPVEVAAYRERRTRLFLETGVNVVEVDATRSVRRLVSSPLAADSPYHIAIFLPDDGVRIINVEFEQSLSRIALPLRGEVVPVELHPVYQRAYQQTTSAWHIQHEGRYTEGDLPFPSLLTGEQRQAVLEVAQAWQAKLQQLEK
jgi:hypothetical protein